MIVARAREYRPQVEGADDHVPGAAGDQEETCSDRSNDRWWTCTRVDGHDGRHEAGMGDGTIIASWSA